MTPDASEAGEPAQILGWVQEFLAALTGPAVTMGALWLALTFGSGEVTHGVRFIASVCMFGMVCTDLPRSRRGRGSEPRQFAIAAFGCFAAALVWAPSINWMFLFLLPFVSGLVEPWRRARQVSGILPLLAWSSMLLMDPNPDVVFAALSTLVLLNFAIACVRGGATSWMRLVATVTGGVVLDLTWPELVEETSLHPPDLSWSEYPMAPPDGAEALLVCCAR